MTGNQLSLPFAPAANGVLYIVQQRDAYTNPSMRSYATVYAAKRAQLDMFDGQNWSHPQVMDTAFKPVYDAPAMAQKIRNLQIDENRMFSRTKLSDFDVLAVPARAHKLFALGNYEEGVRRVLPVNPSIADRLRDDLATLFIGRSYDSRDAANHVGNEVSLNDLAGIAGNDCAAAIAGPAWKEIGDAQYLKIARGHEKSIRRIIADHVSVDHLSAILEIAEKNRYGRMFGMVQNHWQAFGGDYQGFTFRDIEDTAHRHLVTDAIRDDARNLGPLPDFIRQWTNDGTLKSLIPMEREDQFMGRFGETFMRLRSQQDEAYALSCASHTWIVPGGFEDRTPAPRLHRPGQRYIAPPRP